MHPARPTRLTVAHPQCQCYDIGSQHSSPRSQALPSPPDSPESLSSLPSVSSSFFFSSNAASPHTHGSSSHAPPSEAATDPLMTSNAGLIIPSLSLPSALQRPTPHGQTLGELNLLVLGPRGVGKTALAEFLAECDDVVDVGEWEEEGAGRVLYASTDWIEEHDLHGLERFEGTKNVRIMELQGFSMSDDVSLSLKSALLLRWRAYL